MPFDENMNIIRDNPRVDIRIDPLSEDLNIISKLDDEPNDVGGMTSTELKHEFDRGGLEIQSYLNDTLIPEVVGQGLAEQSRVEAEAARVQAESERVTAESGRVSAESGRVAAESQRVTAEADRVAAEQAREDAGAGIIAQARAAETGAQSWAVGGTGTRPGEDTDNAKAYAAQAAASAGGVTGVVSYNGRQGAVIPEAGDFARMGGSNPNLLINGWFTINQRNVATGNLLSGYQVDMWYFFSDKKVYWDADKHTMKFVQSTSNAVIDQYLDGSAKALVESGENYTVSALTNEGVMSYTANTPTSAGNFSGFNLYINKSDGGYYFRVWGTQVDRDVTLYACKLEPGTVCTIGNDVAPNSADELLKCQRFLRHEDTLVTTDPNGTSEYLFINYRYPEMAAKPGVKVNGGIYNSGGIIQEGVTVLDVKRTSGGITYFKLSEPYNQPMMLTDVLISAEP